MSLLEFIFGRKSTARHSGSMALVEVMPLVGDDPVSVFAETSGPEGGQAAARPAHSAEALLAEVVALHSLPARALRLAAGPQTVLQRVSQGKLDSFAPAEARQSAVLLRMEIVHDPNVLILQGQDRSAELVIANRRLVRAQFRIAEQDVRIFDFRQDVAKEDDAVACVLALADFLADPVDLMIAERPANGVFSAIGGIAVEDVFFDEATCRAAVRLSARAALEEDASPAPAQPAAPPLLLVQSQLAFAEDAAVFVPDTEKRSHA